MNTYPKHALNAVSTLKHHVSSEIAELFEKASQHMVLCKFATPAVIASLHFIYEAETELVNGELRFRRANLGRMPFTMQNTEGYTESQLERLNLCAMWELESRNNPRPLAESDEFKAAVKAAQSMFDDTL